MRLKKNSFVRALLPLVLSAGIQLHASESTTNPVESLKARAEQGDSPARNDLGGFHIKDRMIVICLLAACLVSIGLAKTIHEGHAYSRDETASRDEAARLGEADFLSRHAVKLAPRNA